MEPSRCFMFGASVGGLMGLCLSGRLVLFLLLLIPKGSCQQKPFIQFLSASYMSARIDGLDDYVFMLKDYLCFI